MTTFSYLSIRNSKCSDPTSSTVVLQVNTEECEGRLMSIEMSINIARESLLQQIRQNRFVIKKSENLSHVNCFPHLL